jgi:hypothetical protein
MDDIGMQAYNEDQQNGLNIILWAGIIIYAQATGCGCQVEEMHLVPIMHE